jgi:GT2 family glycosyltransferase
LVIDSSEDKRSESVFRVFDSVSSVSFVYLRSLPGLPHQRNVAIDYILSIEKSVRPSHVWYLDDDVEFGESFFERGLEIFLSRPDLALLGAFDENGPKRSAVVVASIASLEIAKMGKVLRSGLALPPRPEKTFEECEFVPGFSMLMPTEVLMKVRFDSSIRMYGEDLEFQLRARNFGKIGCSNNLGLKHNSSPLNRDSARSVSGFSDGFRWRLHKQFPELVSGFVVIYSSLALLAGNLIFGLIKGSPERLSMAIGHGDFLSRLLRRLPVEQSIGS